MKLSKLLLAPVALLAHACAQEPKAPDAVEMAKVGHEQVRTGNAAAVDASVAVPAMAQAQPENAAPVDETDNAASTPDSDEHSWKTIDTNVVASLKHELVGVGQVDGKPITDVQLRSKCQTAFIAGDDTTVIDWTNAGNFAGRSAGGTATIPIGDGKNQHSFTMPDGATFRRVDGSLGLLADECEKAS